MTSEARMSVAAYKRTQRVSETPRDIERQIFSRVTAALSSSAQSFDAASDNRSRMAILSGSLQLALAENIRLWSVLRADLSHADNALAPELRAQLISLALFVERHTTAVIGGTGPLQVLVDVNRSVIDGLSGLAPAAESV